VPYTMVGKSDPTPHELGQATTLSSVPVSVAPGADLQLRMTAYCHNAKTTRLDSSNRLGEAFSTLQFILQNNLVGDSAISVGVLGIDVPVTYKMNPAQDQVLTEHGASCNVSAALVEDVEEAGDMVAVELVICAKNVPSSHQGCCVGAFVNTVDDHKMKFQGATELSCQSDDTGSISFRRKIVFEHNLEEEKNNRDIRLGLYKHGKMLTRDNMYGDVVLNLRKLLARTKEEVSRTVYPLENNIKDTEVRVLMDQMGTGFSVQATVLEGAGGLRNNTKKSDPFELSLCLSVANLPAAAADGQSLLAAVWVFCEDTVEEEQYTFCGATEGKVCGAGVLRWEAPISVEQLSPADQLEVRVFHVDQERFPASHAPFFRTHTDNLVGEVLLPAKKVFSQLAVNGSCVLSSSFQLGHPSPTQRRLLQAVQTTLSVTGTMWGTAELRLNCSNLPNRVHKVPCSTFVVVFECGSGQDGSKATLGQTEVVHNDTCPTFQQRVVFRYQRAVPHLRVVLFYTEGDRRVCAGYVTVSTADLVNTSRFLSYELVHMQDKKCNKKLQTHGSCVEVFGRFCHILPDRDGDTKAGFLSKSRHLGIRSKWLGRYFLLSNGLMTYWKNNSHEVLDGDPKGQFSVVAGKVRLLDTGKKGKVGLSITPYGKSRVYLLAAEDEAEREAWMAAIQQHGGVVQESKRNEFVPAVGEGLHFLLPPAKPLKWGEPRTEAKEHSSNVVVQGGGGGAAKPRKRSLKKRASLMVPTAVKKKLSHKKSGKKSSSKAGPPPPVPPGGFGGGRARAASHY